MKKTIQSCFTILLTVCLFFHHAPIRSFAQTSSESGENALAPVIQQTEPREYNAKGELVGEDLSKRERNIKHFFKDDFSYEAVLYPTTVHVKENGAGVDIDNTLTEQNVKGEQVYKNKKNSFSVLFAKTATSKKLIQLSQGSYEISFSLLDAQSSLSQVALPLEVEGLSASESMKVLKNLSSTITYDEVFKGVKLRYTVLPERLKEDIILTSVDAIQDFRFIYQTKNLSMEEFEGQVVFKDTETGKDIFFLEPPHMMDSAGEISTDITLQLTKSEEGMILTLRPFHGMLAASGVGFVGQMIGGAILSMSSNATNQIITNNGFNDFNLGEMFIDGLIGGLSNRFAGRGMGKSVNIKTLNRNLTKKMLSGSADTISRGVKYYLSQTSKNYFSYLIVPMIKSTLTSLAGNAVVIGIGRE